MKSNDLIDISKKIQEIISYLEEYSEKTIKMLDKISYAIEMKIMKGWQDKHGGDSDCSSAGTTSH